MTQLTSCLSRIKDQLVFDSKLKRPITARTANLKDDTFKAVPAIDSERAILLTQSMKETEGQPMIIRRARGLEKILNEMTIVIWPNELIVGNHARWPRAAPVFPEFGIHSLIEELNGEPIRPEQRSSDPFIIEGRDEATLREIAKWWIGKTVDEYKMNLLPDEVRRAYVDQAAFAINQGAAGGAGHIAVDYPKVLSKGLTGMIREAEEELAALKLWEPGDFEKKYFLDAVIIALKAAIRFGKRFSQLAREMASTEKDTKRKMELEMIGHHCDHVPANPPRTFWEALQSLWFAHLIIQIESNGHSISFGRFDQYMYPFYERDIAAGRITPEGALELIECLWVKTMQVNKIRCWAHTRMLSGYPMFQNLTLGGQTRDGKSAINDLSWLALEATANLKLPSPSVSVRCWNGTPECFLLKCLEVINIHRGGQPALFNDEAIIPAQIGMGVPINEAYDYAIISCVQPGQAGKGMKPGLLTATYNGPKIFEIALNNGKDPRSGVKIHPNTRDKDLLTFESFQELVEAVKYQIEFYNKLAVSGINCVAKAFAELTPTPFVSALMDDCIRSGKDLHWGGGRYNTAGLNLVGFVTVGNSLAALRKVLFDEKKLTPDQIMHALETNFEDNSTGPTGQNIRSMLLGAPKFGNDDDYADLLVKDVFEFTCEDVTEYIVYATGAHCNSHVAPTSAHVPFGGVCGATTDGRKACMPVNDGVSPVQGSDIMGPTAVLKSVTKLRHSVCADGTLLNQRFSPVFFQDLKQLQRVAWLARTYFMLNGMHIQLNIFSAETLRDAQRHPEKYPNLLIRVAGYSALFTTLDPKVQDDIISRTEQSSI